MKNIEEITQKLEEGVKAVFESEKYKTYLTVMSKFYNYSFNNCLLIAMQMPDASLVAGYKAWQTKFNRQVKKGEKAIRILAPIPHKVTKVVDGEEHEVQYMTFRATSVFDISQTEGEEIETLCRQLTGTVDDYEALEKALKEVSPVEVFFEDIEGEANGYYSFPENRIVVQRDMSQMQTIKTMVHEIAHSILHNRETGKEKEADRRTREVQAESVAYTVCQHLGLDTSDYSFEYVAGWSDDKEVKELQASMEVIRKTSKEIIEQIADMRKEVLAA
jgi:Zn-dependent peptidase ImmA (M78 family)